MNYIAVKYKCMSTDRMDRSADGAQVGWRMNHGEVQNALLY